MILPLSAPGIYAGIVLVAITNVGDYVSAAILGGPNTTMIGNIIQTQYVQNADYPIASALALILMATLLLAMALYARVFGDPDAAGVRRERRDERHDPTGDAGRCGGRSGAGMLPSYVAAGDRRTRWCRSP